MCIQDLKMKILIQKHFEFPDLKLLTSNISFCISSDMFSVACVLTIFSMTDFLLIVASTTDKSLNLFLLRHFRSNGLLVELLDALRLHKKNEELGKNNLSNIM